MTTDPPERLLQVLDGLLRPLVRILIARGVTAPALYRLLKRVYVDVARADFRIDDKQPTDSRISLLSGVHRRDVRAILSENEPPWEMARRHTATVATVIGQWLARPEFTDGDGHARPLLRTGEEGRDFESLVRGVSRDIRPRTVLDELQRQGLVRETAGGRLELLGEAVVGPGSDEHKVIFFAANVGDHLAAATENLMSDQPPFLERAVFCNRLTEHSVDRIEARARGLSQALLEDLNRESQELQASDRTSGRATGRYRFGVYFYREDHAGGGPDGEGDA